jgi:hypothetical protein
VSEWVLACGGTVTVNLEGVYHEVDAPADLPTQPFFLVIARISKNPSVTDDDLKRFQALTRFWGLELEGVGITEDGLAHLRTIPKLSRLILKNTGITDTAIPHILNVPALEWLVLYEKNLTDAALRPMPNLESLSLYCPQITSASVVHLKQCTGLRILRIHFSQIAAEGFEELRKSLPRCKIVSDHTGSPDRRMPHLDAITMRSHMPGTSRSTSPKRLSAMPLA